MHLCFPPPTSKIQKWQGDTYVVFMLQTIQSHLLFSLFLPKSQAALSMVKRYMCPK